MYDDDNSNLLNRSCIPFRDGYFSEQKIWDNYHMASHSHMTDDSVLPPIKCMVRIGRRNLPSQTVPAPHVSVKPYPCATGQQKQMFMKR
uniref:Uncharacterized protein n=1 Tax=Romanomermis culicivorax TaxID=13658 RepID=A0A915JQ54_ROMCU